VRKRKRPQPRWTAVGRGACLAQTGHANPGHAWTRRDMPCLPCLDPPGRAKPGHAGPSHALPCLPCPASPGLAAPRQAQPSHTLPGQAMPRLPCLATTRQALPSLKCLDCHAKPRHARPNLALPCRAKPRLPSLASPRLTKPDQARPGRARPRLPCQPRRASSSGRLDLRRDGTACFLGSLVPKFGRFASIATNNPGRLLSRSKRACHIRRPAAASSRTCAQRSSSEMAARVFM
jgi:hypothetical protein